MTHVVESPLAGPASVCPGIWRFMELNIVNDFKMKHPLISFVIQSVDDFYSKQTGNDLTERMMRNLRETMWLFFCPRLTQVFSLSNTQSHDNTDQSAGSLTQSKRIKTWHMSIIPSKYIPSSQSLMIVTSSLMVLGTGFFAANHLGV